MAKEVKALHGGLASSASIIEDQKVQISLQNEKIRKFEATQALQDNRIYSIENVDFVLDDSAASGQGKIVKKPRFSTTNPLSNLSSGKTVHMFTFGKKEFPQDFLDVLYQMKSGEHFKLTNFNNAQKFDNVAAMYASLERLKSIMENLRAKEGINLPDESLVDRRTPCAIFLENLQTLILDHRADLETRPDVY